MRRYHLFEIHDQSWCPKFIRDGLTDYLAYSEARQETYLPALPLILASVAAARATRVIDLCSGGGGPWVQWQSSNKTMGIASVILTDKFPNAKAAARALPSSVSYYPQSVDATTVPEELRGFRTLFTSFHHFTPHEARAILQDAARQKQPVGVFEFTNRSIPALLIMLLSLFSVWVTVPRIRPYRLSTLIFTFLVPVIPFVVMVDGIVSCLRTYTPEELLELAKGGAADGFKWQAGVLREGATVGLPITYLIGLPL